MLCLNVKCRPNDVQRILGNVFLLFSSSFMFLTQMSELLLVDF